MGNTQLVWGEKNYKCDNTIRKSPIVSVVDNYDKLYYPQDTITKSSRYTHWVDSETILRTHTTSGIPNLLKELERRFNISSTWNSL
jgi:phenylalanyl-tRNA synthetase alpha chain